MSDIIRYHNDMNKISFNRFNEKELNLFFSLCFKANNIGTNEIILTFSELRELSNGDVKLPRFLKTLKTTYDKLITLPFHYQNEKGFGAFVLFNKYFVNEVDRTVTIRLSEDFEYILNNLIGKFTKFDLIEFVSLKSTYSKNIFKLLKQWESKKEKSFSIEEFRTILNIPEKYRISEIDKFVIKPILAELPKYFNNLNLEKIKVGRKVVGLKFSWNGKIEKIEHRKEINITISPKLKQTIEKAEKNRFIEKLLTVDNIEILTQMFQENDLIKGLNWAYKEIKQDVSTLNYLVKTIKTGAEKTEKKIVVKKLEEKVMEQENLFDKTFEEVPLNFDKEPVIEISEEEYEEKYKEFLKENKAKHNPIMRKSFELKNKLKYQIVKKEILYYSDIPKDKLLSKNGRPLNGGALESRLIKLCQEMNIQIKYKDKIIK